MHFDQYNLKLENKIKGFDPKIFFMDHMIYVDIIISLSNSFSFKEKEGDN
jgi:hypothetical protein